MAGTTLLQQITDGNLSGRQVTIGRGAYLTERGQIDTNGYYIRSGCLRVFIEDEREERIVRFGYRNELVVALDSYLTGKPSAFFIQALRKTEILVIAKPAMQEFLEDRPENLRVWNAMLADLVLRQLEREQDLLTQSPKARYERVLKRSPLLFQEIPHKYIANYLRMTPETLSRLKKS